MSTKLRWSIFIWLTLVLALPQGSVAAQQRGIKQKAGDLQVQLKVQGITKENFYMGDVWVAPPKFTDIQMGEKYLGRARVVTFDRWGNTEVLQGLWETSDPGMVQFSPDKGNTLRFAVLKAGQSLLRVTAGGISKQVTINAVIQAGAMQVEILQ